MLKYQLGSLKEGKKKKLKMEQGNKKIKEQYNIQTFFSKINE